MVPAVGARGQTAHPNPLWIWKLISSMKKEERERKKKLCSQSHSLPSCPSAKTSQKEEIQLMSSWHISI